MRLLDFDTLPYDEYRSLLDRSAADDMATRRSVAAICDDVRQRGDEALREYTMRFDGVEPVRLRVDAAEPARALEMVDDVTRDALETAATNIRHFHAAQNTIEPPTETMPGVRCWRERRAIDAVGLYVPAGSAPLPSTVLMLGIPAAIAGCRRVALASPPNAGGLVDLHVLAAAAVAGINEIYCVGGAQAIAALAYGTRTIARVDKIFGPGNRFVAAAKRHVAADGVAIDLVAGPSELLVVADESARGSLVAADLLSQAEHDPDARVALVTTSRELALDVLAEIERQLASLPRAAIIRQALAGGFALVVDSLDDALRVANDYAPEHLQLIVRDPNAAAARIDAAGSVFLGPWAPVTAGDYASGTNHTLPTAGSARATSGLSLEAFQTTISFQSITREGLEALAPTLVALATVEGLDAHAQAVRMRTGVDDDGVIDSSRSVEPDRDGDDRDDVSSATTGYDDAHRFASRRDAGTALPQEDAERDATATGMERDVGLASRTEDPPGEFMTLDPRRDENPHVDSDRHISAPDSEAAAARAATGLDESARAGAQMLAGVDLDSHETGARR